MRDVIEVADLEHRYGDFVAVDRISFEVCKGEIFSFLGPNGAGKSTVINVLTTLLPLQKGSVLVGGHDVGTEPEAVRRAIGIVFQEETLDRDLTVWETLEFHGRLYSMPRAERRKRIGEMIALVELESERDVRTRRLSGGMKRRLEIARGLMTRPQVLFLDEPTIGLDTQTRRRLWEYIKEVNAAGTTIFLTTHYMDEADMASDRISIIDRGRIIAGGEPSRLKDALGRDMIYLETGDDEKALQILRGMQIVREAKATSRGLVININKDGTHCLPLLISRLADAGISITGANLKKPSLDDVFVHYTGRELRGEGTEKPGPESEGKRSGR
ncbi:MAG: Trehalose/maltose import ATP-binding protein MalK [Methanosaeta sp. PtaU1.Bin028]|nr:MAG: Trehalose/maltose import ATP-binding protein MalK [Methanosaeta sp. PtaU1.Bin028]